MKALEEFKADPDLQSWKESLSESSFSWVLITTKAMKHEKGLSYYGAVMIPAHSVESVCMENGLGSHYVQRRWREPEGPKGKKAYDYCLALDPTNSVYFSWLRAQLLARDLLPKFQTMTNSSKSEELCDDKVEAALGVFVISERVP